MYVVCKVCKYAMQVAHTQTEKKHAVEIEQKRREDLEKYQQEIQEYFTVCVLYHLPGRELLLHIPSSYLRSISIQNKRSDSCFNICVCF